MRQQVVLPETPRQRRELAALEEKLRSLPSRGKPLPLRLRNFGTSAEQYLASTGGPLPYMLRLRQIEAQTAEQEALLAAAWRLTAEECARRQLPVPARWRSTSLGWSFA